MVDTSLFSNIPLELRQLDQWVCWRYEDGNGKVPYNARNGHMASHSNKDTWSSFGECVGALNRSNYSGIGFVFSDDDNYTFIDLDNTEGDAAKLQNQLKIFKEFDSYSEISPSGLGLHIIIKGKISSGRKRSKVEVYSSHRFATFTGNVHHNVPIAERQELLNQLWEQMGSGPATHVYGGDDQEKYTDDQIIKQASEAVNGDKFHQLFSGDWTSTYPSQSEADLAIIDILAFYTQNRNQIERIFRQSQLGKRDKTNRTDYLNWMINKSFDRMLPPIDIEGFQNQLEMQLANRKDGDAPVQQLSTIDTSPLPLPLRGGGANKPSITVPDGLLGELANFIYATAPRPVQEIAIAGAIGLMAGVCGKAYNISGTGLNQYVLLIANTGAGKEAMSYGIDKLMNAIKLQVPTSTGFIGPSEIASGQALVKYLNKMSSCFVSILGEFGIRLQQMSATNANSAEKALKRMFLDLYNKSGYGQSFRSSIFADAEKNIQTTMSPAFTVLAESTPETFYGALNEEMIADGLLPRFMLIEYTGKRPTLNEGHVHVQPSFALIERFASLVANVEQINHLKKVVDVRADDEADKIFRDFNRLADAQIDNTTKDVIRQLWNRAHIKALKIAALLAVGVNPYDPIINASQVKWAIDIVQSDIRSLSEKFEAGEIGHNTLEVRQNVELIRILKDYVIGDYALLGPKYKLTQAKMFKDKVIPYSYISRRLIAMAAFRLDRNGATAAIKRALQVLIDSDRLREVGKAELIAKYNTQQKSFVVSNPVIFE